MANAHNIITTIQAAGAEDIVDIIATLEDGEALASLGFTDADTADIEEAHHMVLSMSRMEQYKILREAINAKESYLDNPEKYYQNMMSDFGLSE